MATAVAVGGGLLLGSVLSSKAEKEQAQAVAQGQQANLEAAQQFQQTQQGIADQQANIGQQAQLAQLGLLGQPGGNQGAAEDLLNSPLVEAINASNQEAIANQAAASGVSGGNLLTALQDANTATILQAGFGGLGSIANQGLGTAQGFTGLAGQGLGMASNAQTNLSAAQGAINAAPFAAGANLVNQGLNLFGMMNPTALTLPGTGVGAGGAGVMPQQSLPSGPMTMNNAPGQLLL